MLPRLETLNSRVGFMSLAPYVNQTCGIDYKGNEFPRMADIYSAFRGELCPPFPVLVGPSPHEHGLRSTSWT